MSDCSPEKFVNRENELALVSEKVLRLTKGEPFAPNERVIHFVGPSGIGKSCLLEQCHTHVRATDRCVPIIIKIDALKEEPEDFVWNFLITIDKAFSILVNVSVQPKGNRSRSKYGSDLCTKIKRYAENRVVIIFLDEINILDKEQLQSIEDHLLERLIHENNNLVFVTAGRLAPSMFIDFALRPSSGNTFPLSTFDEPTTGEQLEALKPGAGNLAGKLLELGSGVPRNNTKLVAHVVGNPLGIPDKLQAVQALLTEVKGEIEQRFHPVIEAICILKSFFPEDVAPLLQNHPTLGEQRNEINTKELFLELKQVQIGPGGLIHWDREQKSWMMDEPTRALFELEIQMRVPELWRKLHCTAYQTYKKWEEEFSSQTFRDKAIYHLECLQSAKMDCDDLEG